MRQLVGEGKRHCRPLYGSSTYYGGAGWDSAVVCRFSANRIIGVERKTWITCF